MFKQGISLVSLCVFVFVLSCSDETTVFVDEDQVNLVLQNDPIKLKASLSFANSGVLEIAEDQLNSNKRISAAKADIAGDHPITLVAQIDPPTYDGSTFLTASHVHVDGAYAYVSYNMVGEDYFGAIDIVNIADPNNPRLTSRLLYTNADINALQYSNGYVYAVGGVDATQSFTATSNSFVAKIEVNSGTMNVDSGILYGYQPGDNATDVHVDRNEVYVTSGKDGSITIYDTKDFNIKQEELFSDLRSLAFFNNRVALLDASLGIRILDDNLKTKKEIPISSDFGLYAKRTIDFVDDKIMVAEGGKGVGIYSYSSGNRLQYLPISIDPNRAPSGDIVNNAVAINKDIIMMANGGAGLSLCEDRGTNAQPYGVIQIDGSINYVQTQGDYVFAASGQQGLQIMKLNRLSQSLTATCATLPDYKGTSKLVINEGQDIAFKGAKRFNSIQVSGSLLMCGSWTVLNDVDIKKDSGLLEMNGTLVVGSNRKKKEIVIEDGGVLRIEGNLTIYGDLNLKDGSTIEFIGTESVVNIFGQVKVGNNAIIAGEFEDVQNKF
jgi:hypothetical protein